MSTTPYPEQITLETLPQLFAAHRERFGGMTMTASPAEVTPPASEPNGAGEDNGDGAAQPPERPSGVSEDEWDALGDPGKAAVLRERSARQEAERQLAASRARPTPPKKTASSSEPGSTPSKKSEDGELDIASIVEQAVQAAVKPFQEREEQRDADAAAKSIIDAVVEEAATRLHDPSDAIAQLDLQQVTDGNGQADVAKIREQLDGLVHRKPHLAKVDGRRHAQPGSAAGAGQTSQPLETRVQSALSRMQSSVGIRPSSSD